MEEHFFDNELVDKFEEMLEKNEPVFFDSEEFNEIISFYLDIYDYEYALKALQIAFQHYPANTELRIRKLEYFIGTEDLHEASCLIDELKEICPNDTDFLIAVAGYWSLRKMHRKAIDTYKQALENEEEEDYIYNCLGNEYLELKDYEKALNYFKLALTCNLDDDFALFSCVHCYEVKHRTHDCIDFLHKFIDINPYSEEAWFQLGFQYLNILQHEKALQAFDYVVIINPKSIAGYTQKAYCYERMNRWEEAIATYEESLDFDDTAAFAYFKIGQAYNHLEKPFLALKAFMKSVNEDPQFDKGWYEIACLYEKRGYNEEALFSIEKALEIDSKDENYWKEYAYINVELGRFEEAAEAFEIVVDLEPNHFYNWLALTEVLVVLGEYLKAVDVLHQCLKSFNKAEIYYQLSNCYFLLKQPKKGEKYLEMALKLNASLQEDMQERYPVLKREMKRLTRKKS